MMDLKNIGFLLGNSDKFKFKMIEKRRMVEAIAWVIKYFRAASEGKIFFEFFIRGIKDNKLISNPIHILIHEYEEMVISVLRINLWKNISL